MTVLEIYLEILTNFFEILYPPLNRQYNFWQTLNRKVDEIEDTPTNIKKVKCIGETKREVITRTIGHQCDSTERKQERLGSIKKFKMAGKKWMVAATDIL